MIKDLCQILTPIQDEAEMSVAQALAVAETLKKRALSRIGP